MRSKLRFILWILAGILLAGNIVLTETANAARKPEGEVIIALQSLETQMWTPYLGASLPMLSLLTGVYESLLEHGPNSDELRPMLAERWTVSPDGKTYDFYLRKGIQFHGGWGEFTAEDVKFSIELTMAEGSKATRAGQFRQLGVKAEAVDNYHVRISLKRPCAEWLWMMSTWMVDLPILSKQYSKAVGNEKAGEQPVGTGPYKFVEQKIGDYLKLEALETHWRLVPYYKKMTFRIVPEPRTALAMIQRGEADFAPIPLNMAKEVKATRVKQLVTPDCGQMLVHFGGMYVPEVAKEKYDPACPWVPFNNQRARKVRLALEMAIDKEAIRQRILLGYARPQVLTSFAADSIYSDPSWKIIPYDPAKAKEVLTEAGYPRGFEKPITMWKMVMPGREEVEDVAEAVAQYWERNLGLNVKRRVIEYGPVKAAWRDRSDAWICYTYRWQGPYPEPYMLATRNGLLTTGNTVFGMDPRIDEICNRIDGEPSAEKRVLLNRQFGQIWYDGRSTIPIGLVDSIYVVSNKISQWDRRPKTSVVHNLEYLKP